MLTPADAIARLGTLEPAKIEAVGLFRQLQGAQFDEARLVELQPQLERAVKALNDHVSAAREMVRRCSRLLPCPSRFTPPGF